MTMGRLFGTDGIRGRTGQYPLDEGTVRRIGRALSRLSAGPVIIGRDTRESGLQIEEWLYGTLTETDVPVVLAGILTTPGVSFLTREGAYRTGIVISASHNPYRDNGIKIFRHDGQKLLEGEEDQLERQIASEPRDSSVPDSVPLPGGLLRSDVGIWDRYDKFLRSVPEVGLGSLKVVLDCAHGAAFQIAPTIFRSLGADVIDLGTVPDGRNINLDCGALHPEKMASEVKRHGADFGAAFDGDADRVVLADQEGELLDGDHLLLTLAKHYQQRGGLSSGAVVGTVMANMGLEAALKREGIGLVRANVGDRWVWEKIVEGNHELGGEQSGHIILRNYGPAGDGILVALKIASLMAARQVDLSEIRRALVKFPQVLVNVKVSEKPDFNSIPSIRDTIRQVEERLSERGRLLIRYSGTEPLVRIMLEGEPGTEIDSHAEVVAGRFRETIGA